MRRARHALLAVVFALFLPLGLSACGGDDQGEGIQPDQSDEGAPTDPEAGGGQEENGENLGGEAND